MRDDGSADETGAASSSSPKLAHGTTRGLDPTVDAKLVPVGQITRASSPELGEGEDTPVALPIVDPANYQIIKELARGGMGRILEARDLRLGRPIAIKEVLHADEGARLRFDREVRITAGLQHPAIVHVTEAGQWPSGQPFFAMKLIRGKPLDARIAEAATLAERLALLPAVIAVTDALAYAHSKSVIHRDLKPANVLVGDFGETVVIDWGIAKDLTDTDEIVSISPRVSATIGATVEGSVMGTPSFMPPEQAHGERVDARADVYALGAMLYQVLAGVPPYVGRSTAEVLAKVLEERPASLATLVPDAPVDLIAVVEKAMARSPEERFPTANEMVAELKRFQQGMLVKSHDYTTWELTKRWVRRNRGAVIVGAIAMITLVVFGIAGISQILDQRHRADAEALGARAQSDTRTIAEARDALATDPSEALAILKRLNPDTKELRAARMIAADAAASGIAHVLTGAGSIKSLAFSPDGRSLASYEVPGNTIRIWDLASWSGRPIGGAPDLLAISLTPDAVRGVDSAGRIWSWPTTAVMPAMATLVRTVPGEFYLARWSPDGTRVALETRQTEYPKIELLRLVDLRTGDRLIGKYRWPTWTTDGRSVLAHDRKAQSIVKLDVASGEVTTIFEGTYLPAIAGDGKYTWVARDSLSYAGTDQQWIRELSTGVRVEIGSELLMLEALPGRRVVGSSSKQRFIDTGEIVRSNRRGVFVQFDPTSMSIGEHSLLVSDGWPGTITRLVGHTAPIDALVVSSLGTIASGDAKGAIRVWTLPTVARAYGDGHTTATFAALDRGRELVVAHRGPALGIYDLMTGRQRRLEVTEVAPGIEFDMGSPSEHPTRVGGRLMRETAHGPDEVFEMVRSTDRRHVATVDAAAHVTVWDLDRGSGKMLAGDIVHVAINADGSRIATSRTDVNSPRRVIEEWDVASGKSTKLGEMVPTAMLYGPDGRLVIATDIAAVYVFQNQRMTELDLPPRQIYRALAFSEDGTKLFLGSDNWVIEAYDLATNTSAALRGHMGTIVALTVDPSGRRLFSASADSTLRVWNLADGTSIPLRGHTGLVTSIEVGEDNTLITSALDHTARVWDLESRLSRPLAGHEDRVLFASPIARGQRIVAVDRSSQIAEYADTVPHDERLLRLWLGIATNLPAD